YVASSNLGAGYVNIENHITDQLSLTWGLRLESNSRLVSDMRYLYFEGFKYPQVTPIDENTRLLNTVLLPSVMAAWQPLRPLHVQASWSRTVNRPELQELTLYRHYNPLSFLVTSGNPILADSKVDNYDAGVSFLADGGTRLSFAGFYKKI